MTTDQSPPTLQFQEFLAQVSALFEQAATDAAHDHQVQVERAGTIYTVSIRPQGPENTPAQRDGTLPDDFFALQGSAAPEEPTDIGIHKHDYLSEAYEDMHEESRDK